MAAAERQDLDLGQDQLSPQSAAMSFRDNVEAPHTPETLDPLIRALDRAVVRSAQAGQGGSYAALRD